MVGEAEQSVLYFLALLWARQNWVTNAPPTLLKAPVFAPERQDPHSWALHTPLQGLRSRLPELRPP